MNYEKNIIQDFKMLMSYANSILKTVKCRDGEHDYTEWNSHSDSSSRVCWHCKAEMPESKKGEKNYISQKMHTKQRLLKAKGEVEECEKFINVAKD